MLISSSPTNVNRLSGSETEFDRLVESSLNVTSAEETLRARKAAKEAEKQRIEQEENRKADALRKQIMAAVPDALKRLEAAGWPGGELSHRGSTEIATWELCSMYNETKYSDTEFAYAYLYSDGSVGGIEKLTSNHLAGIMRHLNMLAS